MKLNILVADEPENTTDISLRKLYAAILERSLRDLRDSSERNIALKWFTSRKEWGSDTEITYLQVLEFLQLQGKERKLIEKSVSEAINKL